MDAKPSEASEASGVDIETCSSCVSELLPLEEPKALARRHLLFGFDLSSCSPQVQYAIPTVGLVLAKCLSGYLQELVVYGLFERRFSHMQTFLHYVWLGVCAMTQRKWLFPSKETLSPQLSMGTASPRQAMLYYLLLVCLKTSAVTFANLSMTRINYPAKSLCKSASPLVTMLLGCLWFRKRYTLRDYAVSFLLVLGLYLFIAVDLQSSPEGTGLGLFFIAMSLAAASVIGLVQEHVLVTFHTSPEELLYFCFLGSIGLSFMVFLFSGEVVEGARFLSEKGSPSLWVSFITLNSLTFLGAHFAALLISRFGALVMTLTNTGRKGLTIALSFALFPERNKLHSLVTTYPTLLPL